MSTFSIHEVSILLRGFSASVCIICIENIFMALIRFGGKTVCKIMDLQLLAGVKHEVPETILGLVNALITLVR